MTPKFSIFFATALAVSVSASVGLVAMAQVGAPGGSAGGIGGAGGAGGPGGLGPSTGLGTPTSSGPQLRGPLQPSTGLAQPSGGAGTVGNPQMGTTGATPGDVPTLTPNQNLGGTPVGGTPESNAAVSGVNALNPLATPATTVGSGGVVSGLNGLGSSAANQPLQGVVGAVELSLGNTPVAVGPYIGVKVHVTNNTNSPLLLDGDRAALEKGGATLAAVTNFKVEGAADPPEPKSTLVKNVALAAVTVGANLAIHDQLIQNGPVLGRFGGDERRREANAERFGKRIIWTGDSTEGVIFFQTDDVGAINGGNIKVPVCTFPGLDIRGYVSTSAGGLQEPVPPVSPLDRVGAPVKPAPGDKVDGKDPTVYDTKKDWPKHPSP